MVSLPRGESQIPQNKGQSYGKLRKMDDILDGLKGTATDKVALGWAITQTITYINRAIAAMNMEAYTLLVRHLESMLYAHLTDDYKEWRSDQKTFFVDLKKEIGIDRYGRPTQGSRQQLIFEEYQEVFERLMKVIHETSGEMTLMDEIDPSGWVEEGEGKNVGKKHEGEGKEHN